MRILAVIAIAAALAACSGVGTAPRAYRATIERVAEREGEFFSPRKGRKPISVLLLSVDGPEAGDRSRMIRVQVMDFYSPAIHGRDGDRVAFVYAGDLPAADVDFDSLAGYTVLADVR